MRPSPCRALAAAFLLVTALCGAGQAAPAGPQRDQPVYMSADQMGYDKEHAIVVAQGRVEVVQGDYILLADRIAYYQNQNIVKATGNISMLEPDGNVLFANEVQLRDDMQQGVIENFRVRMADNSLFAAREARKVNETTYELSKAVYSPCKLCRDEETGEVGDPLWQLKAEEVEIDQQAQEVTYHNAFFELYGVPVIYTPYFMHPTPGADRKTGVLPPEYSQNSQLGTTLKVPVYINIAPDKDATLTPYLTSEEGPVMIGQYRQATDTGYYQFDGSLTNPDKRDGSGQRMPGEDEIRGHIFAKGGSALSEHWSWGFDLNRSTDDTYLRRYKFGNQDTLRSKLFAEMVKDRDYATVESLAFQGLEEQDDPDRSPFILPAAQLHLESRPLALGSRLRMDASGRTLTREIGSESRRATLETGWRVPFVTRGGQVFEADASVRADAYSISDVPTASGEFSGEKTRTVPQFALTWRYPLMRFIGDDSLTVEPVAQLVARSNGNNPDVIPNDDSLTPEFSDINLFSYNRFAGYDRMENGTRAVYGLRGEYRLADGPTIDAMAGQDVMLYGDRSFPVTNSLEEDLSDYVGRVGMIGDHYELDYRFRLDSDDYTMRRSEVRASAQYDPVALYADYLLIEDDPVLSDREEVLLAPTLRIDENWSLNGYGRRDLDTDSMRSAGGGVTFQNECLTLVTRLDREYTRDRDVEPDTSFSVRLFLKNLN